MDYVSLGKHIKKYRLLAEMTQAQLADTVGCTDKHISQVEKGKNIPSLEILVGIANTLNVGIDQLVYDNLGNRTNFYVQEILSSTDDFDAEYKLKSIELFKVITSILKGNLPK